MDYTEDITDMNSDDILDSEIEELKEELDILFKKRSKSKKKLKRLIKRFKKADKFFYFLLFCSFILIALCVFSLTEFFYCNYNLSVLTFIIAFWIPSPLNRFKILRY